MMSVEQPSATFRPAALLAGLPSPRAGHLPFASDLIAALKPSMIVELGVSYGDTYFGFCQLVTEGQLACACYGIDTWRADKEAVTANAVYDAVSRHNSAKYRTFSHLIRKSFDDALPQFSHESIGVLNLDGLRPYEELKHTFDSWLPKVKSCGVVLLNDISLRGGEAGAWRLWDELQSQPDFQRFSFRNNNGLGVLSKSIKQAEKIPFLATLFHAEREQQERIRRYYFLCAERLELAARLGASGGSEAGCSLFRVFRSEGGDYETTPELSHIISPGSWINLHLDLPQGIGDRPLRMDIANRPAVVDIVALSLRKRDGQSVWTWNPKEMSDRLRIEGTATEMPASDFCRVLSLGNAPHVLLPEFRGSAFSQPLEFEVRLRVDLELSAVREMNQQWADLAQAKVELELRKPNGSEILNPAAIDAATTKIKSEAAKHLAQARIDHEAKIKLITADAEASLEAMRAEFEQQTAQYTSQLEEERRLHQITVLDRDQLIAQQPRMLQEISIAQGNVEELKTELERLSTEMAHMEYDLTELRKLNARLAAALEEERSTRAVMQDSSSWQLTKPFRAVGDLFGPRKKY
jgi:hypothetical protein